jgi:hypothetical protein
VKIVNPYSIKTLCIADGKIDVLEQLTNDGTGAIASLIFQRSAP